MHLKQEVAVSFRLGDKVTRRHLHFQGVYLFHGVMVSQSAHQPCIFIDFWLPCQPPHTVWSTACHYRNVPLKTRSVLSLQPPHAQLTPIKSRAESKLLASCLFLDFTRCINIYSMPYPNYKMNCWLVNVHCKLTCVYSAKDFLVWIYAAESTYE